MHAHSVSGEELLGRLTRLYAPTAMRIHMVPGASYAPLIIVSPHLIVFVPLLYFVMIVRPDYYFSSHFLSPFTVLRIPPLPRGLRTLLSYLLHALPPPLLYYIRAHQYLLMCTLCAPFMPVLSSPLPYVSLHPLCTPPYPLTCVVPRPLYASS